MSYSILTAKQDLEAILHGTTLNQVVNIDNIFNRAARQLMIDIDLQETKRIVTMSTPIYTQVYDYALPVDVKGNRIIDIRPQVNRSSNDVTPQTYGRAFDVNKSASNNQMFQVQFNTGIKTIRIDREQSPVGVTINSVDAITDNGTWAVFGDAVSVEEDNLNYASGTSSLKFNLPASGSIGGLENNTMTAVDLSDYVNEALLFGYVYLPTASDFTSISLEWGLDSSNYYTVTVATTFENTAFQNGWNLLGFNWSSATTVGSPDLTKINYLRVVFDYNGTLQTAVRVDNIVCRLGQLMEIVYYSKFLFRDAVTEAFQETVTDDSNLINLDTETYNLYFNLLAYMTGQQVQGANILNFDYEFFKREYEKNYLKYRMLYPSETSFPQSTYYKKPNVGYGKFYNRRYNY